MTTRVLNHGLEWQGVTVNRLREGDLLIPIWEKSEKEVILAYANAVELEDEDDGWSISGLVLTIGPDKVVGLCIALSNLDLGDHFRNILTKEFAKCHCCFSDKVSARWQESREGESRMIGRCPLHPHAPVKTGRWPGEWLCGVCGITLERGSGQS